MNPLIISNKGPEIETTNYWSGDLASKGLVEFAKDHNQRKRAEVYARNGCMLWASYGVRRMDGMTAKAAFRAYASTLRYDHCARCRKAGAFPPKSDRCISCGGTGIV